MSSAISLREKSVLSECEEIIERGLNSFIEVGNALLRIRNERLYRGEFGTFQEYCEAKWQMTSRHALRMIDAAEIAGNISHTEENVTPGSHSTPQSEKQLRPLKNLPPEKQREAWQAAVSASDGQPTAREVALAVEKVTSTEKVERIYYRPSNGLQYAEMAVSALEKIQPNDTQREAAFERVERWLKANKKK